MKLYEINDKLREVVQDGFAVDEETGEFWTPDRLEDLEIEFENKLEACAVVAKELSAEAEALKAEAAKLTARQKAAEKRAETLKNYMATQMQRNGSRELQTPRCSLKFRKSSRVVVDNQDMLPPELLTVKTEKKPNLAAIKAAIKAGDIVAAHIEERDNLQIS